MSERSGEAAINLAIAQQALSAAAELARNQVQPRRSWWRRMFRGNR